MTTWFEQSYTLPDQPIGSKITLYGIYNKPGSQFVLPIILIRLHVIVNETHDFFKIMYEHNPSMLRQEDPDPTDILCKYQAKLNKIINKILNSNFSDLIRNER